MSSITFNALIGSVHYDLKKGAVKINLIAASHVSMDRLTSLGPSDESIQVTLESAQTEIEVFEPTPQKGAFSTPSSKDPEATEKEDDLHSYPEEGEVAEPEEAEEVEGYD